jgi:hypothetical protein
MRRRSQAMPPRSLWKPQVALLANQHTRLPVFRSLAPAATLTAMGEVRIDPANDRSTLGVMNEFAFHGELHFLQGLTDLEALSIRLSSLILRPLQHRHADPDCDFGPLVKNVHRTKLANVADVGDSFTYSYDFDDGWVHTITAENVIPVAPRMTLPACTDGRGACPPEDCGDPWGYRELLAIVTAYPQGFVV